MDVSRTTSGRSWVRTRSWSGCLRVLRPDPCGRSVTSAAPRTAISTAERFALFAALCVEVGGRPRREVEPRVDRLTSLAQFEVEMRAGRISGRTLFSDDVALVHDLADLNDNE